MTNRAKERKRKEKNYECKRCFTPIEKRILRSYQSVDEVETSEFYQKDTPGYLLAYGHAIIDIM